MMKRLRFKSRSPSGANPGAARLPASKLTMIGQFAPLRWRACDGIRQVICVSLRADHRSGSIVPCDDKKAYGFNVVEQEEMAPFEFSNYVLLLSRRSSRYFRRRIDMIVLHRLNSIAAKWAVV
jgi:hypothetical protein